MIKIEKPTIIEAAGNKPKIIEEFIGRVNSGTDDLSIARMQSPAGWIEPGQKPEFAEYTIVLHNQRVVLDVEGNTAGSRLSFFVFDVICVLD